MLNIRTKDLQNTSAASLNLFAGAEHIQILSETIAEATQCRQEWTRKKDTSDSYCGFVFCPSLVLTSVNVQLRT